MTVRTATTSVALHPLLAERWSPRAFDTAPVPTQDVAALLEAARWAPSANNYQPWRFLVGRTTADGADATYAALLRRARAEFNQVWASAAPVLVAALTEVEHEDGSPREIAPYELGLAVAQLSIEAAARGLQVHQMGGFDAGADQRDLRRPAAVPRRRRPRDRPRRRPGLAARLGRGARGRSPRAQAVGARSPSPTPSARRSTLAGRSRRLRPAVATGGAPQPLRMMRRSSVISRTDHAGPSRCCRSRADRRTAAGRRARSAPR